jgi:hypothetical protein
MRLEDCMRDPKETASREGWGPLHNSTCLATTPFMVFSVTCVITSVTYPNLRCVLGYSNDQQLHRKCCLMTLGARVCS